jgi:predicted HTH transcriptional regulator
MLWALPSGVEIFSDRVEITNPGRPLLDTNRFIDLPPRSRNEALAALSSAELCALSPADHG